MNRRRGREAFGLCALFLVGLAAAMGIGEAVLRMVFPSPSGYFVWPPHLHRTFRPSPELMPGVSGEAHFLTNSVGLRGDEPADFDNYRILVVGGSTTECLYLDQVEAWPQLLQQRLESAWAADVWVGNAGRSGLNSRHHVVTLERLLPQLGRVDAVIVLVGINDLSLRLGLDRAFDPDYMQRRDAAPQLVHEAFVVKPPAADTHTAGYRRTALWRFGRQMRSLLAAAGLHQDDVGRAYQVWRQHRRAAIRLRDALPDMEPALVEYTHNIEAMIDLARRRSTRIVFVTQPSMWRTDLPAGLRELLWYGGVGNFQQEVGKEYYSVKALADAMQLYNSTLREICATKRVECVDLASHLPRDDSVFYDDVHFNENGARMTADLLAAYLVGHGGIGLNDG